MVCDSQTVPRAVVAVGGVRRANATRLQNKKSP